MGISNRDYIRDERPVGFGGMSSGQWAIKYLIIANIAVFVLQNVSPEFGRNINEWGAIRIAMEAGAGGSAFLPVDVRGVDLEGPAETIPPGTPLGVEGTIQPEGKQYAVVNWNGRRGLVDSDSMRLDWGSSYQLLWQLITYGFLHAGLSHLAFNMFALWMFGRAVEPILGSREFLAFYLVGIAISGAGHVLFSAIQNSPAGAVGASGGVLAVVFLTAATFPRMKVYVMLVLPMDLWVMAVIFAVVDVLGMLNPGSGVAHAAHLGGAAFGLAYKYNNWRLIPLWQRMTGWASGIRRRRRKNPNVRIFQPPKEPDSDQVDRLLAKIHEQGEASLTDEEREFLIEASRRMKPR